MSRITTQTTTDVVIAPTATSAVASLALVKDTTSSALVNSQNNPLASSTNAVAVHEPHPITSWSLETGDPNDSAEIVKKAYEQGLIYFKEHNTRHRKDDPSWLLKASTMEDALAAVQAAETKYTAKKKGRSKVSKVIDSYWTKASEKVIQYRDVIDTLVSSNPEYAALIWGGIKFLFTATLNHKENASKIAEAFAVIGENLQELNFIASELYPSASIQRTLAMVYSHIIEFCLRAISWYEKVTRNFFRQALLAIKTSWVLEFQDVANKVKQSSARLREQSGVAHQIETRRIFNVVTGMKIDLGQVVQLVSENPTNVTVPITTQILQQLPAPDNVVVSVTNPLPIQGSLALNDIAPVKDWITALSAVVPFDAQSILEVANTVLSRRRSRGIMPTNTEAIWKSTQIRAWLSDTDPALLELKGSLTHSEASRDFALDLINLVKSTSMPVMWYLSSPVHSIDTESTITAKDIVISLIHQIVEHSQTDFTSSDFKFSPLTADDTDQEWLSLLITILNQIPQIILIIDARNNVDQVKETTQQFWNEVASQAVSTKIKMLLLTYTMTDVPFLSGDGFTYSRITIDAGRKPGTARASLHGTPRSPRSPRGRHSGGPEQLRPLVLQLLNSD